MCSIGGFLAEQPLPPALAEQLTSALLFYGMTRGRQSAGAWVDGRLHKRAVVASELILTADFGALFSAPVTRVLTHTRQPTCGGTGDEQAQPFVFDGDRHVVSVHNGWYSDDFKAVKAKWRIDKPSGVDSEFVTQVIGRHGIDKLPEFLSDVSGSSAIAAFVDGTLYLARAGNPLSTQYIITKQHGRILVFGSTATQVAAAVRFCWLLDNVPCYELPENDLTLATTDDLQSVTKFTKAAHRTAVAPRRSSRARAASSPRDEQTDWTSELVAQGWTCENGIWKHPEYSGH